MYLMYVDESGTHGASPYFVLCGLAIQEQDAWHLQRKLHHTLASQLPKGLNPLDFELHASEMLNPNRFSRSRPGRKPRPKSEWRRVRSSVRMSILDSALDALAAYSPMDPTRPLVLFGSVVARGYKDSEKIAYELLLYRFERLVSWYGRARPEPHERALVIHDKRMIERDVQAWTSRWRNVVGRFGQLRHLADVPLFADSKVSRVIQAADLVSWALWRYYGLAQPDAYWADKLWHLFEGSGGTMHGLSHESPAFKARTCGCPPCASRLWTAQSLAARTAPLDAHQN
jgi:Protein of unknown function (DUF3800)